MRGLPGIGQRLLTIADDPADDDDLRLRKRVGVSAGLLTIQVAESTRRLASDRYRFSERLVDVKGLGEVKAYVLDEGTP